MARSSWLLAQLILIHILSTSWTIRYGRDADEGQFKYIVAIMRFNDYLCGGAIIDEKHILTAAHCFPSTNASELSIIAGSTLIHTFPAVKERFAIRRITRHPHFYTGLRNPTMFERCLLWGCTWFLGGPGEYLLMDNDIAILTLLTPLALDNNIQAIKLNKSPILPYCTSCEFAGWGATEIHDEGTISLQWATLNIVRREHCPKSYEWHRDTEFCAFDFDMETCPLQGDSGSPLVCDGHLVGISSSGRCDPKYTSVFTSVYSHIGFIESVLEKESMEQHH